MRATEPLRQAQLMAVLPSAAAGFGNGLGAGIPVDLGLQADYVVVVAHISPQGSLIPVATLKALLRA